MKQMEISRHCEFIAGVVSEHPEGIGIAGLHQTFTARCGNINRRTLQRRLERLARNGRIAAEGRNVARVYKTRTIARPPARRVEEPEAPYGVEIIHVPVSGEGEKIRILIRKSSFLRRQTGFDRKILENYKPGISQYLPDPILDRLHEIGRTSSTGNKVGGIHARSVLDRLRVDFSWASSRLEGCTYTQSEAEALILSGKPAPGRHVLETRMILNHEAAISMLARNADKTGIDASTLKSLHATLSPDTRRRPKEIPGTVFSPSSMPQFVKDRFLLFLEKSGAISDPFEQAFFVMAQLPYLQPFSDTNKPVSRLAANIPLFRHNLCPLFFVDVPGLTYTEGTLGVLELGQTELLRDVFVWAYERSCLHNREKSASRHST
ncbi:MAG: Fic family protein [Azoarcus sp.]|jgi:hypothetical protein|nr:Fic family protein [Azoarcus sp.]